MQKSILFDKVEEDNKPKYTLIVLFISSLAFSISFSINSIIELFLKDKNPSIKYITFSAYIVLVVAVIIYLSSVFHFQLS